MKINITECNGSGNDVLNLLGSYNSIDKLFSDADEGKVNISALDCGVKWNNKMHWFKQGGEDVPDRRKWINRLHHLPADMRRIPNDTMVVNADMFERELFVTLE